MRPARTARSGFEMGATWTCTCSGDQLEVVPAVEGVDTSGFVTVLTVLTVLTVPHRQ